MIWLVAIGIATLELRATCGNMRSQFNGYGAIDSVYSRSAKAPMRYRVLVPWILGWMKHSKSRVGIYLCGKILLLGATLWASSIYLGQMGALAFAALLATTVEFDYWEQYIEILGILGCLSSHVWVVALAAIAWGMSRETVLIAPALTWFAQGSLWGIAGIAACGLVHIVQGHAGLYCKRWTLRNNLIELRTAIAERLDYAPVYAATWTAVCLILLTRPWPGLLSETRFLAVAWLAASWLMARAREVRVFLPTALWMASRVAAP